jgi:hypothetical protein
MIIRVRFRDVYSKYFTTGPFTYNCDLDVKEGDIVLVDTRFGLSVAQVEKINLKLVRPEEKAQLKNVLEVCNTKYPLPPEAKDGQN